MNEQEFIKISDRTPGPLLDRNGWSFPTPEARLNMEGLVTWRATQLHRLGLVRTLDPLEPTVVGDTGWRDLLDQESYRIRPPLDYYSELPLFYPISRVNVNVTSMQMKTGINQRVFDVPACGGFVLTDSKSQIEDLFDPGKEVICYHDFDEAVDLARYYQGHDRKRQLVADRGRRRVLSEHTYVHRLSRLIDRVTKDFGS